VSLIEEELWKRNRKLTVCVTKRDEFKRRVRAGRPRSQNSLRYKDALRTADDEFVFTRCSPPALLLWQSRKALLLVRRCFGELNSGREGRRELIRS
jgi:hypothetical protein